MLKTAMVLVVALAACGGGEEAPSCQNAIGHYYGAGCSFFDQDGDPTSQAEANSTCIQILAEVPLRCRDEVDEWRSCLAAVPDPSTSNADCDCSSEIEAIITCEAG